MANNIKLKANVYMNIYATYKSYSVSNNTHTYNIRVNLRNPDGSYRYAGIGTGYRINWDITGPGYSWSSGYIDYDYTIGNLNVYNFDVTVDANTDGTPKGSTLTVKLTGNANATLASTTGHTASINFTMPTIPRTSTFTIPSSFTMGSAFTVSISRASSSFTHEISLWDGSTSLYWSGNNVATSGSVNVALSTLAARSPNAMSKVFTVRVATFNGSTHIGSTSKNITGNVPSTVKPTFDAVTVSENVSPVASLVGAYVQTKSRLNLAITGASGIYGSTIRSYNITGVGHNVNASSTVTGYLSVSGNQTIKGIVTDSRGQTYEKSIVVNILPYSAPTLSDLSFRRTLPDKTEAPLGDNVTVRANVEVQSLIVNGVEKNSIRYNVQSAQTGYSFADKANTTSTSLTESYSDVWSGYSVDYSYNFRVRAGDVFGFSGWSVGIVPTGIVTQQWGRATTSFGKMIDDPSYNVQVGSGGIQSDGDIVFGEQLLGSVKSIINDGFLSYEHTYDANNITRPGIYSVRPSGDSQGTQNAPADWGLIIAFRRADIHHGQLMIDSLGGSWTRMRWGTNWSPWQKATELGGTKEGNKLINTVVKLGRNTILEEALPVPLIRRIDFSGSSPDSFEDVIKKSWSTVPTNVPFIGVLSRSGGVMTVRGMKTNDLYGFFELSGYQQAGIIKVRMSNGVWSQVTL